MYDRTYGVAYQAKKNVAMETTPAAISEMGFLLGSKKKPPPMILPPIRVEMAILDSADLLGFCFLGCYIGST